MLTLVTAFLSLLFLLTVGVQAVVVGDSHLALIAALGAWWALSTLVRELF